MRVLGIESSCDETGLALYDTEQGLLAHALHSQVDLHAAYGGVVPELASRDHIRRLVPLLRQVLLAGKTRLEEVDAIAYTQGPGLAGALLVGSAFAEGLATALGKPTLPVHHLEGHLLSPLLASNPPAFPFVALLVSGGHTQLMRVTGVGRYALLGETLDDAAGEAFDKTAKLLGLGYPGGPALSALAQRGTPGRFALPRPMLHSGDFNFSFAGLKTAVLTLVRQQEKQEAAQATDPDPPPHTGPYGPTHSPDPNFKADVARAFEEALVEVLVKKSLAALRETGFKRLVVAGGVGANQPLRQALNAQGERHGFTVFYPELEFCTDNGAMIAFAAALRLQAQAKSDTAPPLTKPAGPFAVRPRWPLAELMDQDQATPQ